jgi:hypothetical protein
MNSRLAKKLAGVGAMMAVIATAGWGLASGTAQADVGLANHNFAQKVDRDHRDRDRDHPDADRDHHFFDRDHGVDFDRHDGKFFGHFPDHR